MTKKKFLLKLIIFTLIISVIVSVFQLVQFKIQLGNLIWPTLAYYALLSFLSYIISSSGIGKDNKTFLFRFYSSIMMRIIFSLFPLGIYLWISSDRNISFIISYILLYFVYTAFEIYFLVVTLRPDLKKKITDAAH